MLGRPRFLALGGLACLNLIAIPAPNAGAQQPLSYDLTGLIRDQDSAPVTNAELRLARGGRVEQSTRSTSDGHFVLNGVQPGDVTLSVRRMGYAATVQNVTVLSGTAPAPLNIVLHTVATEVDPVYVQGDDEKLREFEERRNSKTFGQFFDGDEIRKRDPRLMSDLLRTIPGAAIGASTRVGNRVLLRGCKPTVWVNGMKAYGAELDEVANPTDVAGLEVYLSWAGLPPRYQDRDNPGCGAILVWTKDR